MTIDTPLGRVIRDIIIPAIAHLRQLFPLKMDQVLPAVFLNDIRTSCAKTIDCTDIAATEAYFHSRLFVYKYVGLLSIKIWTNGK